ncbi:MAG: protein kinase, partial [Calditrichaeota bacterium]|nr:protein kinase [Calditrichota bacterium]
HRDIKPANILLDNSDVVKVTDFGLAKMQRDFGVTSTDIAVGTLGYSPPEQLKSLKNTDQRSDLYSIGMTFYEIIAGKLPFNDNDSNLSVQLAILEGKLPSPDLLNPEIPAEFVNLIRKATRKDPADRYQSAAEMLQDVLALEQRYIQAMRERDRRGAFRRLPARAASTAGSTR